MICNLQLARGLRIEKCRSVLTERHHRGWRLVRSRFRLIYIKVRLFDFVSLIPLGYGLDFLIYST